MKKIYLAIFAKMENLLDMKETFETKSENAKVEMVTNQDELHSVLNQPFDLLLVDHHFLPNIDDLSNKKIEGRIWYIHPSMKNKRSNKISFFPTLDSVQKEIKVIRDKKLITIEKTNKQKQPLSSKKMVTSLSNDASEQQKLEELQEPMQPQISQSRMDSQRIHLNQVRRKIDDISLSENKAIGVWAPVTRVGVTTFVMNYAIYLGNRNVSVVVVEGLTVRQYLKSELTRITKIPDGWISYYEAYTKKELLTNWIYKGVLWLPLGDDDAHHLYRKIFLREWDSGEEEFYMRENIRISKGKDITFVDLPGGYIESDTEYMLKELDELWVLSDTNHVLIGDWKFSIKELAERYNLTIKLLVVGSEYKGKKISEIMDIPLLACIPEMFQEARENIDQNKPLIEYEHLAERLEKPFKEITHYLFKKELVEKNKIQKFFQWVRPMFQSFLDKQ